MESGEQFDWANKRSVVVRRVDPIAIYTDSEGDIIIRQQHPDRPLDSVITIPAHQVYGVIEALQRQVKGSFAAVAAAAAG